jgi:hypothetical protein
MFSAKEVNQKNKKLRFSRKYSNKYEYEDRIKDKAMINKNFGHCFYISNFIFISYLCTFFLRKFENTPAILEISCLLGGLSTSKIIFNI